MQNKISREKTMTGKNLFSPVALNKKFGKEFQTRGWNKYRIKCEYSTEFYISDFACSSRSKSAFREMDFV